MTTPIAIADRAAKRLFYGLIILAPACGGGSGAPPAPPPPIGYVYEGGDAALNQAQTLIREHILPALQ